MSARSAQDLERFWSKVDKSGDCWIWLGARAPSGYGMFGWVHGTAHRAHRVAFELTHGAIPNGMFVLHSCDNRRCVNPAHLRAGTHAENMRDMRTRGRQARQRGERCGTAKLTEANARIARACFLDGVPVRLIAERFGVSRSGIEKIVKRESWGHLE